MRLADPTGAVAPRTGLTVALCALAFVALANLVITCVRLLSVGTGRGWSLRLAVEVAVAGVAGAAAWHRARRGVGRVDAGVAGRGDGQLAPRDGAEERRAAAPAPRRRWLEWLRRAQWLLAPALIVLAVTSVSGQWDTVTDAFGQLSHLHWRWVRLAVYAEALSILAFALLGQILLRAGGRALRLRSIIALTLASNALSVTVPAGPAWAAAFSFEQLRRRGVDRRLAASVLVLTIVILTAALIVLLAVGVELAGGSGPAAPFRTLVVAVAAAGAAAVTVYVLVRRRRPRPASGSRRARRPWLRPRVAIAALGAALCNWLTDCACLVAAILAVGGHVPWTGVLVIYALGQVAENLPISPGGVGVVEGTLSLLLVAYGMPGETSVAAVLLYRLMSFWILVPIGWASAAAMKLEPRLRARRQARAQRFPVPQATWRSIAASGLAHADEAVQP
jgi:putative heme transporter